MKLALLKIRMTISNKMTIRNKKTISNKIIKTMMFRLADIMTVIKIWVTSSTSNPNMNRIVI